MAFLVPHNFRLSGLVMRAVLSVGVLLFTLWAGLDLCAVDILAWNLSFLLLNGAHVLYLTYTVWPPRVHPDLLDLYEKVFKPLKVRGGDWYGVVVFILYRCGVWVAGENRCGFGRLAVSGIEVQ